MKLSRDLPNVRFLDLQPSKRLNALLNLANTHLLPQLSGAADLVMPSKLKGMCASGRPAIATAEHGTQIAHVVQKCGIVVQPGDVTALASAIVYLATNPEKCTQLGKAARRYAVNHWNQEKVLGQVEQKLVELCSSPKPESVGVNAENIRVEPAMFELSLKSHSTEFSRDRSE
jgi:colanic acid biosynthesis glycosyl transferase WcaI